MSKQTRQAIVVSTAILLVCLAVLVAAFKHRQITWWYWWVKLSRAETAEEKLEIVKRYEREKALSFLMRTLKYEGEAASGAARKALYRLDRARVLPLLLDALEDPESQARRRAAAALLAMVDERTGEPYANALDENYWLMGREAFLDLVEKTASSEEIGKALQKAVERNRVTEVKPFWPDAWSAIPKIEEEVVISSAGLLWLQRHQFADGSWGSRKFAGMCRSECASCARGKGTLPDEITSPALTALALNAFFSAALAEAYGRTRDRVLKEPLRKAVAAIIKNITERPVTWEESAILHKDSGAINVFTVMALKDAKMCGIKADYKRAFVAVKKYFEKNNAGKHKGLAGNGSAAMTAEIAFSNHLMGMEEKDPSMKESITFIRTAGPHYERNGTIPATKGLHFILIGSYPMMYAGYYKGWSRWYEEKTKLTCEHQIKEGCAYGSWPCANGIEAPGCEQKYEKLYGKVYTTSMWYMIRQAWRRCPPLFR